MRTERFRGSTRRDDGPVDDKRSSFCTRGYKPELPEIDQNLAESGPKNNDFVSFSSHGEATGVLHVLTCILYGRRGTPSIKYGRTWSLPVSGKMYGTPIQNTLHGGPEKAPCPPIQYWLLGVPRRPYEIPRCRSRSGFSPGSLPMKQ